MATTIRYPSALTLGLAQGIPLALNQGISAYERERDRERQDLLTRLHVQQLLASIQDQQEKRTALASAAANLGTVSRGMNPPAAQSQPFTMPVPEVAPGVDTPVPPTGTPGLLAGVEGGGLNMTLPGATPQRPRTSADLLSDPNVATAATGLLRAGIHPWGPGGLMQSPEDYAKQIKTEEDKAQAVKELSGGWDDFVNATDSKSRIAAIGRVNKAGVLLGKWPDQGDFLKFLKDEKEVEALGKGVDELAPIVGRIQSGTDTPADMVSLTRMSVAHPSANIRAVTQPLFQAALKGHGPGLEATKQYYALIQQNPMLKPEEAWAQVEQTLPNQAALARKEKLWPAEVEAAFAAKEAFAKGKAGEEGKRAAVPPEERKLGERLKLAQITNLEEGPGEKAGQREDTLIKSYASQYEEATKKYAPLGPLQGWPAMSKSMFDALRLPDSLYQTVYGTKRPSKKALMNQRVEELYRARHPGQQLLPGSLSPKERAEFEQILTSEDLLP